MPFDRFIGIDYSGASTHQSHQPGLQVYQTIEGFEPTILNNPYNGGRNWTREHIATWLIEEINDGGFRLLIGIDHAFSFPQSYMTRYGLEEWPEFLNDFCHHWPTHQVPVNNIRQNNPQRIGNITEFRLTERWTSSAKPVFLFGVPGAVATSTHAGIPWIKHIRDNTQVKVWPFDGWDNNHNNSVICEVYPSIFRNRYPRDNRTGDEHDAYSVARWLEESHRNGFLDAYFRPQLTNQDRVTAVLEGWIMGVM